ncbi:acyltransferase [Hwanghaeella grinnelliae]|uniref:Acyltransferase n=1 Tax=Hwanghaeella grinnelliae TaxID=2500179 RepID=A0A3S2Y0J6_9PROT|nr:acyltransferase [Hwanghaeella grinnelliae]RVU34115.1 acyltransferase [Hwanghaeella grinnelliae]
MIPSIPPGIFRLLLAGLVVISHLSNLEIGRPAVFAFFALSGYWVTRMYVEKYSKYSDVTVFYTSRALRIFLPFFAAYVTFFCIFAWTYGDPDYSKLLGLPIFGIATTQNDVLGVSWSLDLELQFYLLVPLIAGLAASLRSPARASAAIILLSIFLLPVGWYLQMNVGIWTVFMYLPSFAIGIAIYLTDWKPRKTTAYASAAGFILIGVVVWIWDDARPLLLKNTVSPFNEDWFGMIWTAALIPFYAFNVAQKSGKLDRHFGNMSYALYITHWPVIALYGHFFGPIQTPDKVIVLAVVALSTCIFYAIVEVPSEKVRASIVSKLASR